MIYQKISSRYVNDITFHSRSKELQLATTILLKCVIIKSFLMKKHTPPSDLFKTLREKKNDSYRMKSQFKK